MALIGHPMIGHLVAHRGGHALHTAFAAQVLAQPDAWTLVDRMPDTTDVHAAVPVRAS
jgi:UDP-3-O-[3-hydroxymyristoyl] N-acetylglucosamine deacetylase